MEVNTKLRLVVIWPEAASRQYLQEPRETKERFYSRIQRVASKHHKRGSMQGRLVGIMTNDNWRSYHRALEAKRQAKRAGLPYKHFPRVEFAALVSETRQHMRVDLNVTGITSFGRCLKYFE